MSQPNWKLVADLGDNPLENDAYYIYFDTTGVYGYEAEHVSEDEEKKRWIVHRFSLDRFKTVLKDDTRYFVPFDYEESWPHAIGQYKDGFYKDLDAVASTMGTTKEDLVTAFCSEDFKERARAWRCVGDYHGYDNLDGSPLSLTKREVKERYKEELGTTKSWSPALALLPLLFSFACGPQADAVGEPPTGHNIWIIGDAVDCREQGDLANVAEKSCAAYRQLPFPLAWTGSCDVWYIGIAGPYAIPGFHFLTFECL